MSHDREHQHDPQPATETASHDDAAPGRTSRTAQLKRADTTSPSGILMRKGGGSIAANADDAVARAGSSSSGGALPDDLRSRFEGSLGVDLSGVRVHTGSESAAAASAVGAHAYATGNDIHFAAGAYDPGSERGQHLIAHEVAHTVQQRGAPAMRQHKLAVSSAGDSAEVEADRAADAMVSGRPASLSSVASGILHRKENAAPAAPAGSSNTSLGVKASNKSVQVSLGTSYKLPLKAAKMSGDISVSITGGAKLDFPSVTPKGVDGEVSAGIDSNGTKQGMEGGAISTEKIAMYTAEATKLAEAKSKQGVEDAFVIESVDWTPLSFKPSAEVGTTKKGAKTKLGGSIDSTVTIKFAKAPDVKLKATVASLDFENGKPSLTAGAVKGSTDMPLKFTHDFGDEVKLTVNATVGASVTGKLAVVDELMERATEWVVKQLGGKAAEAAQTGTELAGLRTIESVIQAEALGFAAIGISITAAFVIASNQVIAVKNYAAAGNRAVDSYVAGAMSALGVSSTGGGDIRAFVQGAAAHKSKLQEMFAGVKAKAPPDHGLSDAELLTRLKAEVQRNADNYRKDIRKSVTPTFAKAFAEAYYKEHEGLIFKTEDRNDAQRVAYLMGEERVRVGEDGQAYEVED